MLADRSDTHSARSTPPGVVIVRETREGKFQQDVISGRHHLTADEPADVGGKDSGPGPYDLLLAALGACTSMTLRLYADQKKLPLTRVEVRLRHDRIYAADCAEASHKTHFRISAAALYWGIVNNRKEVIQCLIVYRRGRRHS